MVVVVIVIVLAAQDARLHDILWRQVNIESGFGLGFRFRQLAIEHEPEFFRVPIRGLGEEDLVLHIGQNPTDGLRQPLLDEEGGVVVVSGEQLLELGGAAGDFLDQAGAVRFRDVGARGGVGRGPGNDLVFVAASIGQQLGALDLGVDHRVEIVLELARRAAALDHAILDGNSQLLGLDKPGGQAAKGLFEADHVACEDIIHVVTSGRGEQRGVQGPLDGIRGIDEAKDVEQGVANPIRQRGPNMDDIGVRR